MVEGVEEMIAVLDRNYRYLIANHAYLQAVKEKQDECFAGKCVQQEITYRYAGLGDRLHAHGQTHRYHCR